MAKTAGRLFLGRHGETSFNNPGAERLRGLSRIGLDANGKKDAKELAAFLRSYDIARISASPTTRTQETAVIIAKALDVPWRVDEGLVAWDLGILTGKLVDDAWEMVRKLERNPDMNVPDGVTYREWWDKFLDTIWKYIGWAKGGAPNTLLLSHARNLTAIPELLKKKEASPLDWAHAPEPGSLLEVCIHRTGSCSPHLIKGRYQDKTLRS